MYSQQVISGLTPVAGSSYVEGGAQFTKFGYEHIANGGTATAGSIHWTKNGAETFRVAATALETDGVVAQRLIPSEPMVGRASTSMPNLTLTGLFLVPYVQLGSLASGFAQYRSYGSRIPGQVFDRLCASVPNRWTRLKGHV